MRRWLFAAGVIVSLLALAAPAWADEDAAALYGERCGSCHGAQGEGMGAFPKLVGSAVVGDAALFTGIVRQGGGGMPAFPDLSDDQVHELQEFLKTQGGEAGEGQPEAGITDADAPPLFAERCASCHGDEAQGMGSFPKLVGSAVVGDAALFTGIIRQGGGGMPAFPDLSDDQIHELQEYLQRLGAGGAGGTTGTTAAPAVLPPGDPARGEAYFLGRTQLANGGAACAACHRIAVAGVGSGGLAADLQVAATTLGATGIAASLKNPAFVGMRASFQGHPLTDQERADLAAFIEQAGTRTGTALAGIPAPWIAAVPAVLVFFAVMALLRPRRRSRIDRSADPTARRSRP